MSLGRLSGLSPVEGTVSEPVFDGVASRLNHLYSLPSLSWFEFCMKPVSTALLGSSDAPLGTVIESWNWCTSTGLVTSTFTKPSWS